MMGGGGASPYDLPERVALDARASLARRVGASAVLVYQQRNKMATNNIQSTNEQQTANSIQRQWPQLGKELYSLERALAARFVTYGNTLSKNEKMERAERFKN